MSKKIAEIEGIGPVTAEKLGAAGVKTVEALLEKGKTAQGRDELASATGLSSEKILDWVKMADLFRIKGVGQEYAELLLKAGIDSVKELSFRDAEYVYKKVTEVAESSGTQIIRRVPSLKELNKWVQHAKELPAVIWKF
jgi:predicted flap endonuclease-1-like 5' DNA nuclease